jgi:integration host factor subunit beta
VLTSELGTFCYLKAGGGIVTKKEIVKAISEKLGLTQLTTKEIVQQTFDAIIETLVTDGRIELRNFGVFEVKQRAARKARNPRTGGQVEVPAKYVVTFKPGKEMEAKVRELEEREAGKTTAKPADLPNEVLGMHSNSPATSANDADRRDLHNDGHPQTIPFQNYSPARHD